jgi:hypothetical protein
MHTIAHGGLRFSRAKALIAALLASWCREKCR